MQAAAVVVSAIVPGGDVLVKVAELVSELHGSKPMFESLLKHLQEVAPRLGKIINSTVAREMEAVRQYQDLVANLQTLLERHLKRNSVLRTVAYWSLKDEVQQFKTQLELVKDLMDLDRDINIMAYFEQLQQLNQQASDAQAMEIAALRILIESQPAEFAQLIKRERVTVADLSDLKNEIKTNKAAYTEEDARTLRTVLESACTALDVKLPHISKCYLPAGDIVYDDDDPFATNESELRALYTGTIILGSKVTVKTARTPDNPDDVKQFNEHAKMWHELRHPHVLPLYGANNSSDPLLLVLGRAELGNFRDYLATHRHRIWSLFLDAARGLAYLHKNNIIHNNLKCNNLLVTAEGVGVVSDFLFAFVRTSSAMSVKPQAPSYHWKAPELFDPKHPNGRVESDVYALGMCLFEAFTGSAPYSDVDEDTAIERIRSGQLPTVPSGVNVPTEAADLVKSMCARQFARREKLHDVIGTLKRLAARECARNELAQCDCASPSCSACHRSAREHTHSSDSTTGRVDVVYLMHYGATSLSSFKKGAHGGFHAESSPRSVWRASAVTAGLTGDRRSTTNMVSEIVKAEAMSDGGVYLRFNDDWRCLIHVEHMLTEDYDAWMRSVDDFAGYLYRQRCNMDELVDGRMRFMWPFVVDIGNASEP